ncbi:dipeptidase [Pedobacter paludis]|uniref:dipeptidase n=1 Tax=Pedobacter paludis TaxID=2203212 RepID=UPI001F0C464F|nr:membrane dipeptidase [Pedobacter paludis]
MATKNKIDEQNDWTRRKFLATMSAVSAAIIVNPISSWASLSDDEKKVAEIVAETFGIDTHNHIDVPLISSELPGPKIDLIGQMKNSGLSALVMTFAVDYQRLTEVGQAYERFLNGLTAMDTVLELNKMKRSLNFSDIKNAHKTKTPTVIQSVEGAHFLEGKIERLKVAYDRGLRHLTLLHDNDASVPLGDIFTNPPKWGGITTFGTEVIKECERLGILVDLSHCDNNTINGALKVMTKPFIISHSGLDTRLGDNEFMAKMMKPRLISKEQAKIVANTGGVIGIWTHLADTPTAFADNIKAMVDIVGIDHVAIGTDTKMTPAYRSPNDKWEQPKERPKQNKNDSNFNNDDKPKGNENKNQGGDTTNTVWGNQKKGFYFTVVEALLKAGYTRKEIGKIGGGNYLRIFNEATKGH